MPSTPSDITLAVGDGARRMTSAELAQARSISVASARRLARRHHWSRQVGNDGIVRVTVPLGQLRTVPGPNLEKPKETADFAGLGQAQALSDGTDPRSAESGPRTDPGSGPGTADPLAQAVEALREQLGIANRRIDELQAALTAERRRVIEILTESRASWWRRWFR
jgi:hypothetical protein